MRKIFCCTLIAAAFCAAPVLADDAKKEPAKTETKVEKKDAKPAGPEAEKAASTFEKFDPQSYTCEQFAKDLPGGNEAAGVAIIWAHGYESATYGTDEVGALDEKSIGQIAQEYTDYCKGHPAENFARASKNMTKEEG